MERVLTVEEKIRRAEEIYERRRNQNYRNNTATVNVSSRNRDFRLLKKMIIQVLICMLIYFIFYLIQTTNYVFSASTLSKTKEILDYDIDVKGIYTDIKNNFVNNEENIENIDETVNEITNEESNSLTNENTEEQNNLEENNKEEANTEDLNNVENVDNIEEKPLTIAEEIVKNYGIIKPVNGFITSEFGTREPEGNIVTSYHHGIDIGTVTGTDVVASTDGEVILATEIASYGKYIKIQNEDIVTLYAHCNELLVSVGDKVNKGDIVAKSGATGNVTGPHLHFEVIYKGEYINPRDVLEF